MKEHLMDFFINFIMRTASYLIISYFIYNISGRKRTISQILLGILFLSETVSMLNYLSVGADQTVLFLFFMLRMLPIIIAFLLFMRLTGGFQKIRLFRPRKLKSLSTDIQTKHTTTLIGFTVLVGSLIVFGISYFYVEGITMYVMMISALLSFVFGIVMLIQNRKIILEKVVLIVGRDQKLFYSYDIPKHKTKITIPDFYKNEAYIVDAIGEVTLIEDTQLIEKHYLYWIATNDKVNMQDEILEHMRGLPYQNALDRFEKYHYKKIWFEQSKTGRMTFLKEKIIK